MRTIRFPLGNEDPKILDYLLDTVLMQNGSIEIWNGNTGWNVSAIVAPNPHGYCWREDYTYLVRLIRTPKNMKYSRARYIGLTTADLEEVKRIILDYELDDEGNFTRAPERPRTKREKYKKVTPSLIEDFIEEED